MRKIILSVLSGVVFIAIVCIVVLSNTNNTLAAEVEFNFTKMSEVSPEQALSSNPYDYIDNEYFDNVVALGFPAMVYLDEQYHNGELHGLNAYIAALAMEDISGMHIYECTGVDCENAEQFFEQWDKVMKNLPDTFSAIIASDTE